MKFWTTKGKHSLLDCEETSSISPSKFSLRGFVMLSFIFLLCSCKFVCSEENNQSGLRGFFSSFLGFLVLW